MQMIFLHVYILKVFGALLFFYLHILQPEQKCFVHSVTKAFWYLLVYQINLCDETDYRNLSSTKQV